MTLTKLYEWQVLNDIYVRKLSQRQAAKENNISRDQVSSIIEDFEELTKIIIYEKNLEKRKSRQESMILLALSNAVAMQVAAKYPPTLTDL